MTYPWFAAFAQRSGTLRWRKDGGDNDGGDDGGGDDEDDDSGSHDTQISSLGGQPLTCPQMHIGLTKHLCVCNL